MHRPVVILGLLALLVCAGSASSASGGRAAGGTKFAPDADAYVTAAVPKRNFGKARILRTAKRPSTRSYLHFTLTGIDAPVTSATLRVYARARVKGLAVRSTSANWSERAITFKNAPRAGGVVARAKRVRARRWVSLNVTKAVKGKSAVSFALKTRRARTELQRNGAGKLASTMLRDMGQFVSQQMQTRSCRRRVLTSFERNVPARGVGKRI